MKSFREVVSIVVLLCWCFSVETVVAGSTVVCAVVLEVGSSAFVTQPCCLCGFDLSDTW